MNERRRHRIRERRLARAEQRLKAFRERECKKGEPQSERQERLDRHEYVMGKQIARAELQLARLARTPL